MQESSIELNNDSSSCKLFLDSISMIVAGE